MAISKVVQDSLNGGVAGTGPAFSAGQSASGTSVTGGVLTKIILDVEEFDTNSNFASSRFTPTIAGYYQINGCVNFGTASSFIIASVFKNGSEYKRGSQTGSVSASGNASQVSAVIYFNGSTDYVELYGHSGSSNTTSNSTAQTWFNGSMIRST